jgi:4-amino-4-deoxy-L-arabinose transferase-like glycosyltransferase
MTAARRNCGLFFSGVFAVTLALRLCHVHILWADEDYHMAAGIQALHGKLLYRDLWYDKPPLSAWIYAAIGGLAGWPLRLFDAAYLSAICAAIWNFAGDLGGRRAAMAAAGLMALFLNFDLPSAVMPIAPDFFMLLPHIVAVHCAWKGKALLAGLWCGVAFLFHAKGVFVLASCALLMWRSAPVLLLGFAIPNAAVLAGLVAAGALPQYFRQVWEWSAAYAGSSPELHPLSNGLRRTLDWSGFHAALVLGTAAFWWSNRKRENYWLAGWLALSFAGVAVGARFFPRYYLQLLPPIVLCACGAASNAAPSRLVSTLRRVVFAIALLIPLIRFGPRYAVLAADLLSSRGHQWADVALDQDSQSAAAAITARKHPGDTLFVWGYRPGIYVYTRMPVASRFWDSQPLTGVPADRHLRETLAVLPEEAAANRKEFAASRPTFVVDSLSLSNPRLSLDAYPELHEWMAHYRVVARTPLSLIYYLQ